MTYTFKLARRLAVSRNFSMLPVLLLFAACSGGDATAPEGSPTDLPTTGAQWSPRNSPVAVSIAPRKLTLETNQLIRFRAHGRTSAGDSVGAAVTWSTTGGTILPDGRFSAAAIGTYKITGTNRARGTIQVDTATVVVVRRQPSLASVQVTPASTSLTPGVSRTFTAIGRNLHGKTVPIGVNWTATGGSIDDGGTYVAGDTAGTYQVIAVNTARTLADTATVTISAPPTLPPPPPPPAPPPPTPVLQKVTLLPSSVTLATGAARQFKAYGRTTVGDSVAVNVMFTATGGTVTSTGLYTAGRSAGKFRVIATSGTLADTSAVTVTAPLGSALSGIAFGNFDTEESQFRAPFTGVVKVMTPTMMYEYLDAARARKMRVIVSLAGSPRNYQNADGSFSLTLWKQRVDRFQGMDLTSYIADGTLLGHYLLDEPHDPLNWGGKVVTFGELEAMAQYSKQLFPNMTTFVRVHPSWLKGYTWKYLDAAWAQYSARKGDVNTFLQTNVLSAKALGLGLIVGLNVLDGGDGSSGIPGTMAGAYSMSASELRRYGSVLAADPYACGFIMWRDRQPDYFGRSDIQSAMLDLSQVAANRAPASCRVH